MRGAFFVVGAAVWLGIAASSEAATLQSEYRLQDTYASSVGGAPPLTDLGFGQSSFATEPLASCPGTRVLTFPKRKGLNLPNPGIGTLDGYTIDMVVRLDAVDEYRKLIQIAAASENGLYVHNGKLDWYDAAGNHEGGTSLVPGGYTRVTMTGNLEAQGESLFYRIRAYVNGSLAATALTSQADGIMGANTRLFRDDEGGFDEDSGGAVAWIRVYSGAMTALEVEAGGGPSPLVCPPPAQVPETSIDKQPKHKTTKKRATFEFSSPTTGAGFECSLDDKAFASCVSPTTVRAGKGKHVFRVRAVTGAGPDPTPAQAKWKVKPKRKRRGR
jgi:hypothetical protein